jgi:hypothetical protein
MHVPLTPPPVPTRTSLKRPLAVHATSTRALTNFMWSDVTLGVELGVGADSLGVYVATVQGLGQQCVKVLKGGLEAVAQETPANLFGKNLITAIALITPTLCRCVACPCVCKMKRHESRYALVMPVVSMGTLHHLRYANEPNMHCIGTTREEFSTKEVRLQV